MDNLQAEHLGSGREAKHWPKPGLPEYAFIGRSNVGKSSLINMLVGINKLARVSSTPGKTRNVEHFRVDGTLKSDRPWMLADLPGYGFAKVSLKERAVWQQMIHTYLKAWLGEHFNFYMLGVIAVVIGVGVIASLVKTRAAGLTPPTTPGLEKHVA